MSIDTYAKLQSEISDTINRNDLLADVTRFTAGSIDGAVKRAIRRTELRLQRRMRVTQMEGETTGSFSTSADYITKPADFLAVKLFYVSGDPIQIMPSSTLTQLYTEFPTAGTGKPQKHSVSGSKIYARPTPDSAYDYKLFYFQKIPQLTDSNTTNWLLEECEDAYLYGACLELTPHLAEDERIQVWKGALDEAIADITGAELLARYSGVPLQPVQQVALVGGFLP